MTDDLRDQLALAMKPDIAYIAQTATDSDIEDAAYNAADALLARFAIAGELPEPDQEYTTYSPGAELWTINDTDPLVYLSSTGQVEYAGTGYWSTRKGDDPRPFAAALIAAFRKAQEQTHE